MTPAAERELRDKITEAVGLMRALARTQAQHGRQLDRLDQRQDQTDITLAQLVQVNDRISALERWRYTIAGGWVAAGMAATYLTQWLVHR